MEHFTYSYKYRVLPGPCELVHQEPAPREQWVFHHLNLISTENTGTQPYQPGSLVWSHSAINGSIHVSQEWGMGSKCITSAKLRVPQTTHNTYTGLKKKKGKKTMRHLVEEKLSSQTPHCKWMVSVARFLSHAEITESPTWPIKKRKQPS